MEYHNLHEILKDKDNYDDYQFINKQMEIIEKSSKDNILENIDKLFSKPIKHEKLLKSVEENKPLIFKKLMVDGLIEEADKVRFKYDFTFNEEGLHHIYYNTTVANNLDSLNYLNVNFPYVYSYEYYQRIIEFFCISNEEISGLFDFYDILYDKPFLKEFSEKYHEIGKSSASANNLLISLCNNDDEKNELLVNYVYKKEIFNGLLNILIQDKSYEPNDVLIDILCASLPQYDLELKKISAKLLFNELSDNLPTAKSTKNTKL